MCACINGVYGCMYMYVCMWYVCMQVQYVYGYWYTHMNLYDMHIRICVYMHVSICVHVYLCVYYVYIMFVYMCVTVCVVLHLVMFMFVHACLHVCYLVCVWDIYMGCVY